MGKHFVYISILFAFLFASCKSQFETIRTSNDPELMLKEANTYFKEEEYYKAQSLYELVIPFYRGKKEAEDLFYNYAYTHYNVDEYILASHYFKQFSKTFYNSDRREEAAYMSAFSNYHLSPNMKLDQTYTQKAIDGFQEFINNNPRSSRVEKCNDLIDELRSKLEEKAFNQGQLYYKIGEFQSALKSFEIMLKDYPESERAEKVRLLMLKSSYTLAQNSYIDKRGDRYRETLALYKEFNKRHAKSRSAKEAKEIYNNTQKELEKLKV